jgi:hypothetical protein
MMGQPIEQVLSLGVAVALSPMPIIAVVLMLATPKYGRTALCSSSAGSWGLAAVGTIVPLIAGGASASTHGSPKTCVSVLKIALGPLLMLVTAGRTCARRSLRGDFPYVAEGAVRDFLLLASIGGSKQEPRPADSQPLTLPLIRECGSTTEFAETSPSPGPLAASPASTRARIWRLARPYALWAALTCFGGAARVRAFRHRSRCGRRMRAGVQGSVRLGVWRHVLAADRRDLPDLPGTAAAPDSISSRANLCARCGATSSRSATAGQGQLRRQGSGRSMLDGASASSKC